MRFLPCFFVDKEKIRKGRSQEKDHFPMSGAWSVQGHEQGHWGTQAVPVSTARWGRPGVSHPRLETCWLLPHRSVSDSSGFEGRAKFASRRREHFEQSVPIEQSSYQQMLGSLSPSSPPPTEWEEERRERCMISCLLQYSHGHTLGSRFYSLLPRQGVPNRHGRFVIVYGG